MNKKLNIIISNYDSIVNPHYFGGGAIAVHEICRRLAKKHEVKLLTGVFKGSQNKKIDGVSCSFVGSSILGPKLGHILYQIAVLIRSRTEKYDLWIEGSSPPTTFSFLPLVSKGKVVSWIHMLAGSDMYRKYKIPFQLLERYLARNYKYFIVPSKWVKNKIQKEYGNNQASVKTISNGVLTFPSAESKKIESEKYFLFLGRLEVNQKGLDLLISAFSKLDRGSGVKLMVVGSGSEKETGVLRTIIDDHNLSDRVKILSRVEGKEKEKLLSGCLALVLPSRFDTYPLVVLEAFSYFKPVILFDLPQLTWIPRNASLKIKCYDIGGYTEALKRIIDDEDARVLLGKNAYGFVKTRTWHESYKRFLKYIESIYEYRTGDKK